MTELLLVSHIVVLVVGIVFGGWALQWAQDQGATPDDGYEHSADEFAPPTTRQQPGKFGQRTELRPDGYWYADGKRVVSP